MPKISALPAAVSVGSTDLFAIVQGSTTKKATQSLVLANIQTNIQITESQVTNLTTDLAAKLAKASNLSDVADVATSRSNLGLGTAALLNTPIGMTVGGTGANLTADNGAIVYSTGTTMALLAHTTTANQIILSGNNAAPSWSTTTYPATNAINTIMYASSANVLGVVTPVNSALLISSAGGVPSWSNSAIPAYTMAGALTLSTSSPSANLEAASKGYVDAVAQGRVFKDPSAAASTTALTVTYANGASGVGATLTNATTQAAFAIDGYTAALNDRILIKNQASTLQNGIYTVTTLGSGAANWVLTRAVDMDLPAEFKGATTFIINGTVNAGRTYTETATVTAVGTDPVTFSLTGDGATSLSVVTQLVLATGTYTPTTGMVSCDVQIVGGGGGGGGANGGAAVQAASGGGGGGGGYCFSTYSATEIGASASVVIGAAGAGGAAGNNNGTAGGASSFDPAGTGATMTANGGAAGNGSAAQSIASSFTNPQLGGTASGGQVNIPGCPSTFGLADGTVGRAMGGAGGASLLGAGGIAQQNTAGAAGLGYGAGGSGAAASATTTAGGAGVIGVCIITEYISV